MFSAVLAKEKEYLSIEYRWNALIVPLAHYFDHKSGSTDLHARFEHEYARIHHVRVPETIAKIRQK